MATVHSHSIVHQHSVHAIQHAARAAGIGAIRAKVNLLREMHMSGRDAQLNFSTVDDVLSGRSNENFDAHFPSVALEKVRLNKYQCKE